MKELSQGDKIGVTLCSPAYIVGGNWGYLQEAHTDYAKLKKALQEQDVEYTKVTPVRGGLLVTVPRNILDDVLMSLGGEAVIVKKIAERDKVRFVNQDWGKYGREVGEYTEHTLGIYSNTISEKVRVNGVEYPVYGLNLKEVIGSMRGIEKEIYVRSIDTEGVESYVAVTEILQQGRVPQGIKAGMIVSATGTCLFLMLKTKEK